MLSEKTKLLRKNRSDFRNTYGRTTEAIVKRIAQGQTSKEIANELDLEVMSVAATRANYTRGTYWPYVSPYDDERGNTCQY